MASQPTPERSINPDTGRGTMDKRLTCPNLHGMTELRSSIFRRPLLTTVFNHTDPVRGRHMANPMVHSAHQACPPVSARLARQAGFDPAAIARRVEAGIMPSLKQPPRVFCYHDAGEDSPLNHDPRSIGTDQPTRAVPLSKDTPVGRYAGRRHRHHGGYRCRRHDMQSHRFGRGIEPIQGSQLINLIVYF